MKKNQNSRNTRILAKEWFEKAKNDLKSAEILFNEDGPTDSICFHSQQAVEKYLKGFLVYHNVVPRKTHDLAILLKECAEINEDFKDYVEEGKFLNKYYIESRYPPEVTVYSKEETKEVLEQAKKMVQLVKEKVKSPQGV